MGYGIIRKPDLVLLWPDESGNSQRSKIGV
jgi:hypothetical protein